MSAATGKFREYWQTSRPRLLPLSPLEEDDAVTYHRHWILLARNITLPVLICLLDLVGWAYYLTHGDMARVFALGWAPNFALFGLTLAPWAWLLWRYEDWRNDYYIVTSDRVVDVDRRPFGFGGEVREAPMANVQNVSMRIPGFLASALDFGDINVETAGQQSSLVFHTIHHPRQVLARVASMVDDFREARLAQEQASRQQELTTWFSTYADLGRVAIVESPALAKVGDRAEVCWRVSGQAAEVDTWLDWRLGEASYRVAQQYGGPGNYRGSFTVPLVEQVSFCTGARIADNLHQSKEEMLRISDFEMAFPAEAPAPGRPVTIRWRHEAKAEHAEVLWDCRSHGREDAYAHLETAEFDSGWWTYSFNPPAEETVYFRIRGSVAGNLLYSAEHTIAPYPSPGQEEASKPEA